MQLVQCVSDRLNWNPLQGLAGMTGKADPNHEAFIVAFGQHVRKLREDRGWSLRDMVLQHGYHASQWQAVEKGGNLTLSSLLRISSIFGMTLCDLIGDLGSAPIAAPSKPVIAAKVTPPKKTVVTQPKKSPAKR